MRFTSLDIDIHILLEIPLSPMPHLQNNLLCDDKDHAFLIAIYFVVANEVSGPWKILHAC